MQDEAIHRKSLTALHSADTVEAATGTGGGSLGEQDGMLPRGENVGRYVVLSALGEGGMGVVYAAYDPELDRKVALKFLHPSRASGDVGRARLIREAQALGKLSHPNVVGVHDVGTFKEHVWVAMEFVKGVTLKEWLLAASRSWKESVAVLLGAADGVIAAHRAGLVHRDLKPDNVMIGDDRRVRVMDFGLAHGRLMQEHENSPALAPTVPVSGAPARPELEALKLRLTATGTVNGTPAYMSPEQWLGKDAGPFTDQFSWSVMAWESLYGESPFEGDSLMAIAANVISGSRRSPSRKKKVPSWVRRILERGLDPDPSRRWPSMERIVEEFRRRQSRSALRGVTLVALGTAGLVGLWGQASTIVGEDEPPVSAPSAIPTSTLVLRVSPTNSLVAIQRSDDTCARFFMEPVRAHCSRRDLPGKEIRIARELAPGTYIVEYRENAMSPRHWRAVRVRRDDLAVSIHSPPYTITKGGAYALPKKDVQARLEQAKESSQSGNLMSEH